MVTLSAAVTNKARLAGAQQWVDDLDSLIAALADEWRFTVRNPLAGASEAYLTTVTLADGTPAVLKLLVPRPDMVEHEIAFLERVNGDGCARLLRADASRAALLLEHLGPPLSEAHLPIADRDAILAACAARIWRPVEPGLVRDGSRWGDDLANSIVDRWTRLNHPCTSAAIDVALASAEHRDAAYDPDGAVLCHGDVHPWNALRAGDGYTLVDPDGIRIDPSYDLGVIIREDPHDVPASRVWARADRLARVCHVDPMAVFEWGLLERVSTGLLLAEIGMEDVGRGLLAVADELAGISGD